MAKMPEQKPGRSKQDYQTPPEFMAALEVRLGIEAFDIDLAADENNKQAEKFYSIENSALLMDNSWKAGSGWSWCNPPYAKIEPWVSRAVYEKLNGAKIAMLLPAGVGANWYRNYVDGIAYVTFLNGRITFVGTDAGYPKDLMVLLYAPYLDGGTCVWDWQ